MEQFTILCVDDEITVLDSIRQELKSVFNKKYQIEVAQSGEEGLELLKDLLNESVIIPVIISDQLMPGMKGDEFLTQVNRIDPSIKKILLTGQASIQSISNAINKANLYRFLQKPWHAEDLKITIEEAIKSYVTTFDLNQRLLIFNQLNKLGQVMLNEIEPFELLKKVFALLTDYLGEVTLKFFLIENGNLSAGFTNKFFEGRPPYESFGIEEAKSQIPMQMLEEIIKKPRAIIEKIPYNLEPWKYDSYIQEKKPKAIACLPLYKTQQVSGILILENFENPQFFDAHKTDFLLMFAQLLTSALDNTLLYKYLEQKVQERTQTIEAQKREILDSIRYARRIQKAILPKNFILQKWFSDSAILYLPKDIVSGDFFWFAEENDDFFVAVADCTGHGVPGAFMSVLGINALNSIVKQKKIMEPGEILAQLHSEIINSLNQEAPSSEIQDGMDIALIKITPAKKKLTYASANRPILLLQNGEIFEWQPDKICIGHAQEGESQRIYQTQKQDIAPGDRIFLFTDGYTDQFGGSKEKRITKKGFFEYLKQSNSLTLKSQVDFLKQKFLDWKGDLEQTDDVLVLGLQF
jgi:serine phosphatase RsbU (regulator of sigma subunit)/FixJ family two-component response regulator